MTWLDVYGQISDAADALDDADVVDDADALMLLMRWCCWCADAVDAVDAAVVDKMQIGVRAHLNGIAWSSEIRTVVQRLVLHKMS